MSKLADSRQLSRVFSTNFVNSGTEPKERAEKTLCGLKFGVVSTVDADFGGESAALEFELGRLLTGILEEEILGAVNMEGR